MFQAEGKAEKTPSDRCSGPAVHIAGPVDCRLLWQTGRLKRCVLKDVVKRLGFSHAQRGFASVLWPEVMSVLFLNGLAVFKNIHFLYYLTFYLLHNDQ